MCLFCNETTQSVALARTIDELVDDITAPRAPRDHGYSYVRPDEVISSETEIVGPSKDEEWTREQWLDWYEEEFAGYAADDDPDSFVFDAGSMVSQWQLASDNATAAHLDRDERSCYRYSADGTRSVKGEHPFSTDEGAAEWLARVRIELRDAYRRAGSDRERSAIVAREAALRARHNARCWTRACARYYGVNENLALSLLNLYQSLAPLGWLGIEREMHDTWLDAERHFESSTEAWDRAFDGKWSQAQKDEWLDRQPVRPEHPTQLVTSAKRLRRYIPGTEQAPAVIDGPVLSKNVRERLHRERLLQHRAVLLAKLEGLRHRPLISKGNVRRWLREDDGAWFEWVRSEMPVYTRRETPESIPMPNHIGDLDRDFARLTQRLAQHHTDRLLRDAVATRYLSTAA